MNPFRGRGGRVGRACLALVLLAGLGAALPLGAQEALAGEAGAPHPPPGKSVALLVNIRSLLLDLESFGGGIGFNIDGNGAFVRLLGDLYLFKERQSWGLSTTLAATYGRYLAYGSVAPYWGVTVSLGVETNRDVWDADRWAAETTVPLGTAGLLGVSLSLTEQVSLFFEYALAVELAMICTAQTSGELTIRDSYTHLRLDTGLGNQSRIGVAIVLPTRVRLPRRETAGGAAGP